MERAAPARAEEGEEGVEAEEWRRPSMRRPLKWGPAAASITSSIDISGISIGFDLQDPSRLKSFVVCGAH